MDGEGRRGTLDLDMAASALARPRYGVNVERLLRQPIQEPLPKSHLSPLPVADGLSDPCLPTKTTETFRSKPPRFIESQYSIVPG